MRLKKNYDSGNREERHQAEAVLRDVLVHRHEETQGRRGRVQG